MELTDKFEIKVFILYLLKNIGEPLDITTIGEVVMMDAFVNYFDFSICFSDLLDSRQVEEIEVEGEKLYVISETGALMVGEVQSALYAGVKDKALRSAQRLLALKRTGNRINSSLTECGGGYMLTVSIVDNEKTLLKLETYVTDEDYAKRMQANFNERAEIIYKGAMALLSGDVNFIFDE
ncbi:MAG: DUF4364 family protein [Clostridia bacterium]|nr:DUF4364 family protein [Clostridia bacterium]